MSNRIVSFSEEIELDDIEFELSTDDDDSLADSDDETVTRRDKGDLGEKSGDRSFSQSQAYDWSSIIVQGSEEERWLHQLKKLECIRFVPATAGGSVCHCGRLKTDHPDDKEELDGEVQWNTSSCIVPQKTDAIGKILFKDDDMQSMFFRLTYGTTREEMMYLLNKILHMADFNLYIHFLDFEQDEDDDLAATDQQKLHSSLEAGLKTLAQKTKLVISSMGLKTGVSRHIHSVLEKLCEDKSFHTQVFRLACPPWGSLTRDEREQFKSQELMGVMRPGARKESDVIGERLSLWFSHYLLYDDGIIYDSPVQANSKHANLFRKRIEKLLTRMNDSAVSVFVMMNGGPKMLDHVIKAIKRNTPIIIVKRTGGFADKLAKNYLRAEKVVKKEMDDTGKFIARSVLILAEDLEDVEPAHTEKVWQILQNNHLLTVFDPAFISQGLDMVICQALLKGRQEAKLNQLLESFLSNSSKKKLTATTSQTQTFIGSENMQMDFLIEAMLNDCSEVVDIILKGQVKLTKHFTMKRLCQLYNREQSLGSCLPLLKAANAKNVKKYDVSNKLFAPIDVRRVLLSLLGENYSLTCQGKVCQCLLKKNHVSDMVTVNGSRMFRTCLPPVQEMFLWALLTNHQRLAKVFWKHCQDKLASALVAEILLTRLAEREGNTDRQFKLQENAQEFDDLAVEVLRICYELDEKLTHDLLMKKSVWWGDASVMELAYSFRSRRFVSQPACKSLLDRIWLGEVESPGSMHMVWILLSTIPGVVLVPFLSICSEEPPGFTFQEKKSDQCCSRLRKFYNAPIVKYYMNVVLFVVFLAVFSYVLLVDLQPKFTIWQGVLCAWVATYLGEEIRQILSVKGRTSLHERWKYYWFEGWNKLDVTVIVMFVIGMVLVAVPYPEAYHFRRVVLSIDFVIFSMRLLQAFAVGQEIGPMLTMILKMIRDTVTFVIILFVFILSYAVASESILFPRSKPDPRMLYNVPRKAYWQIYGDFFLGEIEGTEIDCTTESDLYINHTMARCPSRTGQYVVPLMLAVYCIVTHVLLLNLLIAKFNDTYSKVQGEAKIHWAWYRCQIFHEYALRPSLPPPLNAFSCLYWLLRRGASLVKKVVCCRCCPKRCRKLCRITVPCSTQKQSLTGGKVSMKVVGTTTVSLRWRCPEDGAVSRYRIWCYKITDPVRGVADVNNPDMVLTLYAMDSYTVRDLTPDTLYRMKMEFETDSKWNELGETEVKTLHKGTAATENHESHCMELMEKVKSEDENLQKLDQVVKCMTTNKQEITQSFQQVKGDISQLTQKVQELDKNIAHKVETMNLELAAQQTENKSEIMKQTQTSVGTVVKNLHEQASQQAVTETTILELKKDLEHEKELKTAMLGEIQDLRGQMTQMQETMENLLKALKKP